MNTLNSKNINLHSPYMVGQIDENDSTFYLRKDNPRLKELLAEFEETISIVFDWEYDSALIRKI